MATSLRNARARTAHESAKRQLVKISNVLAREATCGYGQLASKRVNDVNLVANGVILTKKPQVREARSVAKVLLADCKWVAHSPDESADSTSPQLFWRSATLLQHVLFAMPMVTRR